jgi:hypothetical protein
MGNDGAAAFGAAAMQGDSDTTLRGHAAAFHNLIIAVTRATDPVTDPRSAQSIDRKIAADLDDLAAVGSGVAFATDGPRHQHLSSAYWPRPARGQNGRLMAASLATCSALGGVTSNKVAPSSRRILATKVAPPD